jgi:hypothetical protein
MNNDINAEIFEYLNFNHIKSFKLKSVLSFLFPSSNEKNEDNYLKENDRNDLIYELIKICFGLNERNEGNYYLFKTLYLMQSRAIKYDNLYQEMKEILEKAKNNNYDLEKIKLIEKECINFINNEEKSKIPECFKNNEIMKKDFKETICNIIPYETGKIHIRLAFAKKNFKIYSFEYFTTYFTKEELLKLRKENCDFTYNNLKRQKIMSEKKESNKDSNITKNITDFKDEKDLFSFINKNILEAKDIILENPEVINRPLKNTIVRYYIYNQLQNSLFKFEFKKETNKEDNNFNFYLPEIMRDIVEDNGIKNLLNIFRIKDDLDFFRPDNLFNTPKIAKADKYLALTGLK